MKRLNRPRRMEVIFLQVRFALILLCMSAGGGVCGKGCDRPSGVVWRRPPMPHRPGIGAGRNAAPSSPARLVLTLAHPAPTLRCFRCDRLRLQHRHSTHCLYTTHHCSINCVQYPFLLFIPTRFNKSPRWNNFLSILHSSRWLHEQ